VLQGGIKHTDMGLIGINEFAVQENLFWHGKP
jgi:hypothetical protein